MNITSNILTIIIAILGGAGVIWGVKTSISKNNELKKQQQQTETASTSVKETQQSIAKVETEKQQDLAKASTLKGTERTKKANEKIKNWNTVI